MSYGQDYSLDYRREGSSAISAERATFIRRTYAHLAGALLALIAIEAILMNVLGEVGQQKIINLLLMNRWNWLIVLVAFMVVGMVAQNWAQSSTSRRTQYMGLGLYVIIEAVILLPMLIIAQWYATKVNPDAKYIIPQAGILTLAVFGGLTLTVLLTKKDFSFLRTALSICSFLALGIIVAAILFGFSLGLFFTVAMIALMAGYIVYYTSNVLHHYHTSQYVAASLALFAAIATMFWYILRLLMILYSRE